jgi:hypothetical protein
VAGTVVRAVVNAVAETVSVAVGALVAGIMYTVPEMVVRRLGVVSTTTTAVVDVGFEATGMVPVQKEPMGQQAALPALSRVQRAVVGQQAAVVWGIVEQ